MDRCGVIPAPRHQSRGKVDFFGRAIESDHLSEAKVKSTPMRLGEIIDLIFAWVPAADRLPPKGFPKNNRFG